MSLSASMRWAFYGLGRAAVSGGLAWALIVFAAVSVTAPVAVARDLSSMDAQDIAALQHRLTDAGCYPGAIDGKASAAVEQAQKICPVTEPLLRIETGMHTAPIQQIGVDRACRLLATGSDDKTVRLWSLPQGKLLQTLRPPIGLGNEGKINAVAVSPDGSLVAAGGWDAHRRVLPGHSVYLFDAATGTLKARIGAFENVIFHVAFSPDGRYLAATLFGSNGLRVIDVVTRKVVAEDKDYGANSFGAAFAPDGRLYTVAYDGYLRAYDRGFKLTRKVATRGGKEPFSVDVDPSGERIVVGFFDSSAVEVYHASDLRFLFAADTTGIANGNFLSVAWSAGGERIAAGGQYNFRGNAGAWWRPVAVWDRGGRGKRREQAVARDTIISLLPCGSGFAVGGADPLFALLGRDDAVHLSKTGVAVDMRDKRGDAFQVTRDGRQVRFGLAGGDGKPALFDLVRGTLTEGANAAGLAPPRITGISVSDWLNNFAPKLAGKPLKLDQYERSRSLAIAPDAKRFVLGTNWSLRAYDPEMMAGLGIQITTEDGFVKVVRPIEGSPAAAAGILANDIITHVDGNSIKGLVLDDVIKKLRGPVGTHGTESRLTVM
jgi:DNA-binding beta-propeller fold protein YncE